VAPVNLVELIKGLLPIVITALALGHLGDLRTWAAYETFRSWRPHPFFPIEYSRRIKGRASPGYPSTSHRSHGLSRSCHCHKFVTYSIPG